MKEIVELLGGESTIASEITGISTDSRTLQPGELFIPLKGENFDGHKFLEAALGKGAVAALSSEKRDNAPERVIRVEDTLAAYHKIAACYRSKFSMPVIAITGSNGKTTTKDLMAHVLAQKFRTLKTPENFNNEVGVPQTLLQIGPDTEMVVIELAMRGKGQIRQLAQMVKPSVGVITNIGEAHYELLGSYEAIADAKGELLGELPEGGAAILNADDEWFAHLSRKTTKRIYSFGQNEQATLRLKSYEALGIDGFRILVEHGDGHELGFTIPMLGFHNVYNGLAAIAAGFLFDLEPGIIQTALDTARLTGRRMEKLVTSDGVVVINDVYNASPRSTESAIKTLTLLEKKGKTVVVLGDMRELGEISEASHRCIGRSVRDASIDYLVTLGDMGKWIYEGALEAGMPADRCLWYSDRAAAMKELSDLLQPGDVLLIKASRLMKFEEIVDFVMNRSSNLSSDKERVNS